MKHTECDYDQRGVHCPHGIAAHDYNARCPARRIEAREVMAVAVMDAEWVRA